MPNDSHNDTGHSDSAQARAARTVYTVLAQVMPALGDAIPTAWPDRDAAPAVVRALAEAAVDAEATILQWGIREGDIRMVVGAHRTGVIVRPVPILGLTILPPERARAWGRALLDAATAAEALGGGER